jgi:hypothetical protein
LQNQVPEAGSQLVQNRQNAQEVVVVLFDADYHPVLVRFPCAIVVALAKCLGSLAVPIFRRGNLNPMHLAQRQAAVRLFVQADDKPAKLLTSSCSSAIPFLS